MDREAHRPKPQGFCKVDITKREGLRMDKREMIERAWDGLRSIMGSAVDVNVYDYDELFDNLAKMIVIEGEARHCEMSGTYFTELRYYNALQRGWSYMIAETAESKAALRSTPGPYVLFGVPKPKEKEDE